MYCPVVLMLSASTFSAALLLFRRSSPEGVGVGVGVGVGIGVRRGVASASGETNEQTTTLIPEKSVAVLPFENLSRNPDNAYFAEGIQDEILTRLSKIADLRV